MLIGVHCSVSRGVINAFDEAKKLGIDTFQIFTKNQRQWKEKSFSEEESEAFRNRKKAEGVKLIFSHSSYLINLASGSPELLHKSREAILGEVQRCHALGLSFTVLHPGSARDLGEEKAIESIARSLRQTLDATPDSEVKILLENTAGQGMTIGGEFRHLKEIYERVESDRIGFCFDTCHAFAAGYDIRTRAGLEDTLAEWDRVVGLDKLHCLHLNDSKGKLGSHLDRHEHIGLGEIGEVPFSILVKRFPEIPKVFETPKKDDWDEKNLAKLRSFLISG